MKMVGSKILRENRGKMVRSKNSGELRTVYVGSSAKKKYWGRREEAKGLPQRCLPKAK